MYLCYLVNIITIIKCHDRRCNITCHQWKQVLIFYKFNTATLISELYFNLSFCINIINCDLWSIYMNRSHLYCAIFSHILPYSVIFCSSSSFTQITCLNSFQLEHSCTIISLSCVLIYLP